MNHVRLIKLDNAFNAIVRDLKGILDDVCDDYPHIKKHAERRALIFKAAYVSEPVIIGSDLVVDPFNVDYIQIYNLVYDYYNV